MRKRNLFLMLTLVIGIAVIAMSVKGQTSSNKTAADEVIAIAKAQWAAEQNRNVAEAMKNIADDYTEFNGDYSTRIEGKEVHMRLAEANAKDGGKVLVSEMVNPKVQVYGDVAILTYNYIGVTQNKDGVNEPVRAKSTRVYVKQSGKWMLVHANFGPDPRNIR